MIDLAAIGRLTADLLIVAGVASLIVTYVRQEWARTAETRRRELTRERYGRRP